VIALDFLVRQGAFTVEIRESLPAMATAITGPSGAGKTTIVEAVAYLRRPERGLIRIGVAWCSIARPGSTCRLARDVGYVPQDVALFRTSTSTRTSRGARLVTNGHRDRILRSRARSRCWAVASMACRAETPARSLRALMTDRRCCCSTSRLPRFDATARAGGGRPRGDSRRSRAAAAHRLALVRRRDGPGRKWVIDVAAGRVNVVERTPPA
jgi:hypothetical protein